jgi:hypothetical protein
MTEGLCNVGPTFCKMTKTILKDQVSRNVLSYVDNIVVASKKKDAYIFDLADTFTNMCEARLKLNPKKCIFGITRVMRIGTQGTTPHRLGRPKEGSAMTRPTIWKIPEDHDVLPKV